MSTVATLRGQRPEPFTILVGLLAPLYRAEVSSLLLCSVHMIDSTWPRWRFQPHSCIRARFKKVGGFSRSGVPASSAIVAEPYPDFMNSTR